MEVFARSRLSGWAVAAGLLTVAVCSPAADLALPVTGNLLGTVVDVRGVPQMGASIQLFNKFERLIARAMTDADGQFAFASLPADSYSVRVSAPSYLPMSRDRIPVKAGLNSLLQIHLATLLGSMQVSYTVPVAGMSNDWKWVLRSSPATRPIVRYLPDEVAASQQKDGVSPRLFSSTHAMLSVSGGDGNLIDSDAAASDLGTAFLISTNILGKHELKVGGNFAQDTSGVSPGAMSLCALYTSHHDVGFVPAPEIAFSVSQFLLVPGQSAGTAATMAPPVRSMSLSVYQTLDPLDGLHLEYGMVGESIEYLQHTTRVSPFARATISAGALGEVVASYSDGGRPDELAAHQPHHGAMADASRGDDLAMAANTFSRMPQFSYGDGRLELQRTHSYEIGYRKALGSRTLAVSAFHEGVVNGRVQVAGDVSALDPGGLLSDGLSETRVLNIGRYQRNGFLTSVTQDLGDAFDLSVAYGRMGGFTANSSPDWGSGGSETKILDQRSHNVASANLATRLPMAGTKLVASYGWMDGGAVIPAHVFTTQNGYVSPGFNVLVRQPLPPMFGIPGHFELMADLRNLLAQGYLPIATADGQKLLVVQAPRAIRGGVNFVF